MVRPGGRLLMHCDRVKLPGGTTAIICSRGRRRPLCRWCPRDSSFQCDWKVGSGRTCDKHLCAEHAKEVAADKHLCPEHEKAYEQWLAKRGLQKWSASPSS